MSQIDFKGPQARGTYFALEFPSGGGYEACNALFKGFVGTEKTVSFIDQPDSRKLLVFEGFMDFLSFLTIRKNSNLECAVLVLNSTNLWRQALPHIQDKRFDEIELFLDTRWRCSHKAICRIRNNCPDQRYAWIVQSF